MPNQRRILAIITVVALVVAGCSSKSSSDSSGPDEATGTTFAVPSTTLPMEKRLLAVDDLPGGWSDAGGLDYQTVSGDQPQRCFNALDTLDGGADDDSAGFKYNDGLPVLSEVIFSFQPGATEPAVEEVAKQLNGCGSFVLTTGAGTVTGEVVSADIDLHGLDDPHTWVIRYQGGAATSTTTVLLGRKGDSVLLVLYQTGADVPKREDAQTLFQLAINKFTSGSANKGDHETA